MSDDRQNPHSGVALARDFLAYCQAYPHLRFWQALSSWSGQNFIIARREFELRPGSTDQDTYNWNGRGPEPDHAPAEPGKGGQE